MKRGRFIAATAGAALQTPLQVLGEPLPAARIELGNEVFLSGVWRELGSRPIGIIANQSGVTSSLQTIVDAVQRRTSLRVRAVFAPEHGFRGDVAAGSSVASYVDEQTHLPVRSLYGATRRPTAAMLADIDVLLFDIQDVGSRAYTYVSTMAYAMQGAREFDKEFWVLDRPNPVGGTIVEGPVLQPAFASFIGLYPIPMRHGMTIGELARLFNDRFGINARLRVIPMRGWQRSAIWPDTGLQWVPTSPNVPTWETTFVYLCTGLVDNAGVNNGTGFTNPFFYAGGAGVDAQRLAARLNAGDLPGVWFRPAAWSPTAGFWQGRELHGVELVLFDPRRFLAVRTSVEILTAIRDLFPHALRVDAPALDRDWGTALLRDGLRNGSSSADILASWGEPAAEFEALRRAYLLY
jgi:uncharacterized protein YbbC (DUF1343 family)